MLADRTPFQKLLFALDGVLVLLILAVGSEMLVAQNNLTGRKNTVAERVERISVSPTPSPSAAPDNRIAASPPVNIEIPALALYADVIPVGLDKDNNMEVPPDASKVGWYSYGAKPGEIGRALLTAHYDTPTGKPAIFYNLRKLSKGDLIFIRMEGGEEVFFQVDEVISEPVKTFPTELIFGQIDGKEMTLITCDGVWNPIEKSYSKRLVVFARLWENKTL